MGKYTKNKVIKMALSEDGIKDAMDAIDEFAANLKRGSSALLDELAEKGKEIAQSKFNAAQYDGTNDVSVSSEDRGKSAKAVVAEGNATLFIEFGSGVFYPDNHPAAAEHGMVRGEYGKGHGKHPPWTYTGHPGTSGKVIANTPRGQLVSTYGNPANMCMYHTKQELKEMLPELARKAF